MSTRTIPPSLPRPHAPGRRRFGGPILLALLALAGIPQVEAQFAPGSGGTVPDIAPFTDPVDSIGGL